MFNDDDDDDGPLSKPKANPLGNGGNTEQTSKPQPAVQSNPLGGGGAPSNSGGGDNPLQLLAGLKDLDSKKKGSSSGGTKKTTKTADPLGGGGLDPLGGGGAPLNTGGADNPLALLSGLKQMDAEKPKKAKKKKAALFEDDDDDFGPLGGGGSKGTKTATTTNPLMNSSTSKPLPNITSNPAPAGSR